MAILPFSIGFVSHILIDLVNKRKVRILWPLKIGFGIPWFSSDGIINSILFVAGFACCVLEATAIVKGLG